MQMTKGTILYDFTPEQIKSLFEGLNSRLNQIEKNFQPKEPPEFLSRAEVAKMLGIDLSSVHNWTVKGKLLSYGIGGRVYYKRSEVEAALIPLNKNVK